MTLTYTRHHPLQVTAAFDPALVMDGCLAYWVIGRDLIADGLVAPAGLGDVHVYPCGRATNIELHSGPDYALLTVATADLARFLNATCDLVPLGSEVPGINWNAIAGLLQ